MTQRQIEQFDNAVHDAARRQAARLRELGYHHAAAEVDEHMQPGQEELLPEAACA